MGIFLQIILFLSLDTVVIVLAAENVNTSANPLDYPYCFRFTWLGPKFNNESESQLKNITCEDLLPTSKNIPCKKPLVASDNSNIPNTTWMWDEFMIKKSKPKEIACRLSTGDVCAKISYVYNSQVENITYMCTKVSIDGEGAAPNGCYLTDYGNGRTTEVCVCESSSGRIPCNYGNILSSNIGLMIVLITTVTVVTRLKFFKK